MIPTPAWKPPSERLGSPPPHPVLERNEELEESSRIEDQERSTAPRRERGFPPPAYLLLPLSAARPTGVVTPERSGPIPAATRRRAHADCRPAAGPPDENTVPYCHLPRFPWLREWQVSRPKLPDVRRRPLVLHTRFPRIHKWTRLRKLDLVSLLLGCRPRGPLSQPHPLKRRLKHPVRAGARLGDPVVRAPTRPRIGLPPWDLLLLLTGCILPGSLARTDRATSLS